MRCPAGRIVDQRMADVKFSANVRFVPIVSKNSTVEAKEFADSFRPLGGRVELMMGERRTDQAAQYYEFSLERCSGYPCAGVSPVSAGREHHIVPHPRRTPSPLRPGLSFRYAQRR